MAERRPRRATAARSPAEADTSRYPVPGDTRRDGDIPGYPDERRQEDGGGADIPGYPSEQADEQEGADIPGYPSEQADEQAEGADIPGYPRGLGAASGADSGRYRAVEASPATLPEGVPLFKDSGFESIDDYLEYVDELWRKRNGLPARHPDGLHPVRPADGGGSRQVGLRLPDADFRRLREFADEFGLPPATLARMIVVRAVRTRRFDRRD